MSSCVNLNSPGSDLNRFPLALNFQSSNLNFRQSDLNFRGPDLHAFSVNLNSPGSGVQAGSASV